ncbi:MAG TPA: phosphotransferase [Pseudonocardiaceae bacterium]|nr:phosphotransferase [Pseudonocardiaceae bacterium]
MVLAAPCGSIALDAATRAWLADEALPGRPITSARWLAGGFVNTMMLLITDQGERYVLRRYRTSNGPTACAVETSLAARLIGTVPMVEVVSTDPEGRATGAPLLLSRYVEGAPLSEVLPELAKGDAAGVGYAVGATLARIGTVTFPRAGSFRDGSLATNGQEVLKDLPGVVDRCLDTGKVDSSLTKPEQDGLRAFALRSASWLDAVTNARQLVHMDFNPKNLLVTSCEGRWDVAAVIDWEFAFSGSPLVDVGNMLRFADYYPPDYVSGFRTGLRDFGGALPTGWRQIAQALDLFTLAGMLTDPPDDATFEKIVAVIRRRLQKAT